jgi:hypothetical protein
MQKILICGGRHVPHDISEIFNQFSAIVDKHIIDWSEPDNYGNTLPIAHIIHGNARGVDTLADRYAVVNWLKLSVFPADWTSHGKAAGFIRNQQMIDENPDLVLAFNPGRGTEDTIRRAKKASITTFVYQLTLDNTD